ncbi:polysaccharide deacetylase family protein [Aquimarina algicola]|uniref:NodB homology domain-containing protein n=1 Tax=Aquimarina algicola TaxID=2589995 RepID=A0A504JC63_9FLAO|nr:polysaccharide deacetylase family protein [Aquimarina algicola]TPN86152.1 hypothetical protein FHK87_12840 [Aquimarina algicola]
MGIVKNSLYQISHKKYIRFFKQKTIYPYYHIVRDNKVAHIKNLYPYKNKNQFEADLKFLLQHYQALDPKNLLEGSVPENSFLLTFDDGLEEIYSVIYPILKRNKVNAIFFINPDFVDNQKCLYKHSISVIIDKIEKGNFDSKTIKKIGDLISVDPFSQKNLIQGLRAIRFHEREKVDEILKILEIDIQAYLEMQKPYVTKDQIKEMMDNGFYFGGHTMSHPPLHEIDLKHQKKEILDSIKWLKSNFDITYSLFAFPFSDKSATRELLEELFLYDADMFIFGNAGIKKDIDNRIIQRFSLEHPDRPAEKQIVTEHLYSYFNKLIGNYRIKRK